MKLSDALRGAADRAPMDEATVEVGAAVGRVRRRRAVRAGSTGLVGAGAVAVIAFGALGPVTGASTEDSAAGGEMMAEAAMDGDTSSPAFAEEDSAAGMSRPAEQWMCGSTFDPQDGSWSWGDTSGVTFTIGEPEVDGEQYLIPNTLTASRPVDLISGSDYLILWDGIVVGRWLQPDPFVYGPADEPVLPDQVYERLDPATDFSELEQWTVLDPVNCWDGAPLPAATYEVHQAWTLAYAADAPAEPAPAVTDAPVEEGSEGTSSGDVTDLPTASLESFRVAAGPQLLTIEGDVVDEPFADYLGTDVPVEPGEPVPLPQPVEPEPLPDGYLTPDIARELFDANAVDAPWDMAEGTQRVVKVSDSQSSSPDDWERNFYGCTWEASSAAGFPERSAQVDLLGISVSVPSSISVSYGFVVDGNPLLQSTVSNTSEYTIPNFWGGANPQLYLVKDGRVVAESYPQSLDDEVAILERAASSGAEIAIAPAMDAVLEPGAAVSGEYLWRDVNGCAYSGSRNVDAGTYTVLALQSLSLSNEQPIVMYGEGDMGGMSEPGVTLPAPAIDEPIQQWLEESGAGQSSPSVAPDMAIAPAPDFQADWLELQVWTSLGTVTVR